MSGWISQTWLAARALTSGGLKQSARAGCGLGAAAGGAGFFEHLFDRFAGFARALLNAANQFVLLAFGVLEIRIRELGPFLFQLALGDVPVAFYFECGHDGLVCFFVFCLFSFAVNMTAKVFPRPAGRISQLIRTSALGNRFRCEQGFHSGIECSVARSGGVFGGTAQRLTEQ